jgi:hypothetical protein
MSISFGKRPRGKIRWDGPTERWRPREVKAGRVFGNCSVESEHATRVGTVLFDKQELARLHEIAGPEAVEVHSARKIRTVKLDLVDPRVFPLVHKD